MESVTFDSWKGGEYGLLGPREAGKQQQQMFTGKNVLRYRDGLLGPRPGVRNLGVTGLGNGVIKGLTLGNVGVIVVIGSTVYSFDQTVYAGAAAAWTMTDSITNALTKPAEIASAFSTEYVLCYGGDVYKLVNSTKTCTKIVAGATTIPPGRCCCFYQDRLIVGGTSAQPGRLYFSDPGGTGWETFQSTSYYDLPGLAITFVVPFRTGLLVGTASGAWVYITGTLGLDAVVRTLSTQASPPDTAKAVKLDADEIVYLGKSRAYPAKYNGALHQLARLLEWAGPNYADDSSQTPTFRAIKLIGADDWIMLSGQSASDALNRALMHYEGVSTYHTWGQDIRAWALDLGAGKTLLVKDGTAGTPPVFYMLNSELPQRPAFATDPDSRPGDDSTTPLDAYVHLPQWFPPDNSEITVRGVVIDFKKWNTGAAANNHFEVTVRAVNRYASVAHNASAAQTFDEAGSSTTTAGEDQRLELGFGDQGQGDGFEVYIDAIKGVAIRSITVLYDKLPSRT